jgi:hypothetical protein
MTDTKDKTPSAATGTTDFHSQSFLKADGSPDIGKLIAAANRCTPSLPGGTAWLDNVRFCHWGPSQWTDGRKHDISGTERGAAFPWDGASDCRPFTVDGIVNDRVALKVTAFWRAVMNQGGSGDEAREYSVTLADYLIWTVLFKSLVREVELAAQYEEHYGWTVLAVRWRREMSLRRVKVTLEMVQEDSQQAQQTLDKLNQAALRQSVVPPIPSPGPAAAGPPSPAPAGEGMVAPGAQPTMSAEDRNKLEGLALLPAMIMDPALEEGAVEWFLNWYDGFIKDSLPEELQDKAPEVSKKTARRVVRELRT